VCNGDETCDPDAGGCQDGDPLVCDDDGNSCTDERCDPNDGCVSSPVQDATPCEDGDACTDGDRCEGGQCQPGDPVECEDGNPCTEDSCDPDSGCVSEPVCETAEDCGDSICIIASCDDGCCSAVDACPPSIGACWNITGACDEVTGCLEENEPDGTPCDTATGGTFCGGACDGACQSGVCVAAATCPCFDLKTIQELINECEADPTTETQGWGDQPLSCNFGVCTESTGWECTADTLFPDCLFAGASNISRRGTATHSCSNPCETGHQYGCHVEDHVDGDPCVVLWTLSAEEFEACREILRDAWGTP
jgi:hypothetical protein